MGQPILDLIAEFLIMQSKGVGKFCLIQFGCNKQLDLLTLDVLNRFYCITSMLNLKKISLALLISS